MKTTANIPFSEANSIAKKQFQGKEFDVEKSKIKVENIKGSILLFSATNDEIIPAVTMAQKMISRLESNHFKYPYELVVLEGSHTEPTKHFDKIFSFLDANFLKK